MRVLVTGASGFIGLNIVEALVAQGDDAIGFDRSPPPRNFQRFPAVVGDVRDSASLEIAFQEQTPDAVVHAAALTPGRETERERMAATVEVNIQGTVQVLEAAARARCARVLFLSSASVYGASAYGGEPLDEERTTPSPVMLYAVTKLAAERLALRYREIGGLEVVAARLGAAVLPRASRLDWNYSRDAARALVFLLSSNKDVVNVGPSTRFNLEHFCEALAERYPKFRWRIGEPANVDLHGSRDRAPLAIERLRAAGFAPRFDEKAAYDDYLGWLQQQ